MTTDIDLDVVLSLVADVATDERIAMRERVALIAAVTSATDDALTRDDQDVPTTNNREHK